jgi:hypothetical protein
MAAMKVRNFVLNSNVTVSHKEGNPKPKCFSQTALTEWRPDKFSINREFRLSNFVLITM